jgi:aminoglycoside phosphotransferase (APT) family kinase protein
VLGTLSLIFPAPPGSFLLANECGGGLYRRTVHLPALMPAKRIYDIRSLARHFVMPGDYVSHAPCGQGHINDTYEIRYNQAGTFVRYILQRINHEIFTRPAEVMDNIRRVTTHIASRLEAQGEQEACRKVLTLVPCRDGSLWHEDRYGNHWRGYFYIEGAEAHNHVNSTTLAEEAARAFGSFQKHVSDMNGPRLADTIPDFHNTRSRFDAFVRAVEEDRAGRKNAVAAEIDWVMQREPIADVLLDLQKAGKLPERITHNDTKINNVMIDHQTGEGLCVMDLDTVMPGLVLYDFGDLVRTTAISTAEDERDASRVMMRLPIFDALVRGYLSTARDFLTKEEIAQLAFSGKLITFELATRFLADHLNGDVYFKIHRPGHNLDRFRVQAALIGDIDRQFSQMQEVVANYAG